MALIEAALGDALSRYLDLSTRQMRATAVNMANIDTPGYRTQGIDFEAQFAQSLHGGAPAATETEVTGLISRPDGNNVSIDRESVEMAKAQLQFRTGIELLRHEYTRIADAIKSN